MLSRSPIPFEEFMRRALYDPACGYYTRQISGVGRTGDFTTAPMLSEYFGKSVAAWAARTLRETGLRNLIEIGPGEGRLAAAMLRHLPWTLRRQVRLHLVETSAPLAEIQKRQLRSRALVHATVESALAACSGNAVIYSNELVDAFPVRRFQKSTGGWRELAVSLSEDGRVIESWCDPAPLPDSSAFSQAHQPGQWIEVHDAYRRWIGQWMPRWKSGGMLTIDYGSTADSLYHRRPAGSLRAYLMHQRLDGPAIYQNAGRQDLTADVNFTDLMDWSRPWVKDQRLCRLSDFTGPLPDSRDPVNRQLFSQDGAGSAFLVLEQRCRS